MTPVPVPRPLPARLGQPPPFAPPSWGPTWAWLIAPVSVPVLPRWVYLGLGLGLLALAAGGRKAGVRLSRPVLAVVGGVVALWSLS